MDGVLWRGAKLLPGVAAFFRFQRSRGLRVVLATNSAAHPPEHYLAKLAPAGVALESSSVLTSALVTADWLARAMPSRPALFALGGRGLTDALKAAGFPLVVDGSSRVAAVVVGFDPELTYAKLKAAALHLQRGAAFVATNADASFPAEEGELPGAGATVAALTTATGLIAQVVGKPEPWMFEAAVDRLGLAKDEIIMVGDRLDTDILGARRFGLRSVLVQSGSSVRFGAGDSPDMVVADIAALAVLWEATPDSASR